MLKFIDLGKIGGINQQETGGRANERRSQHQQGEYDPTDQFSAWNCDILHVLKQRLHGMKSGYQPLGSRQSAVIRHQQWHHIPPSDPGILPVASRAGSQRIPAEKGTACPESTRFLRLKTCDGRLFPKLSFPDSSGPQSLFAIARPVEGPSPCCRRKDWNPDPRREAAHRRRCRRQECLE